MQAILVIGPESSGTRMLTEAIVRNGYFGDYGQHFGEDGHKQRLDDLDFSNRPDHIVLRRSYPHGGEWIDAESLIQKMELAGYSVRVVVILRDKDKTIASQVKREHSKDEATARTKVEKAMRLIFSLERSLSIVYYDVFVQSASVRQSFFERLGLTVPDMQFAPK